MPVQGPITAPKGSASDTLEPTGGPATAPPDDPGTSQVAPGVDDGSAKSEKADQTQVPAKTDDTELFFDPKDLPEELLPYHKQLQAAFTKKTQAIKKNRDKIEAYDAFMQDVPGNLQRTAQQYGFRMVPIQQSGYTSQAGTVENQPFSQDWQPGSYAELYQAFADRMFGDLNQRFGPVFKNVENLATSNVERQLFDIDKDWRIYEDDMAENLKKHPTLAHDIPALYKMSVPESVLNSRAVKEALEKMEKKAKSAKIQGKGTAAPTSRPTGGKMSFAESVEAAKDTLAKEGLTP